VAFLELWLGLASVVNESVHVVACTPQYYADKFGSLGMLRMLFVLGTPSSVMVCDP